MTQPPTPSHQFLGSHCAVDCFRIGDETVLAVRGELDVMAEGLFLDAAAQTGPWVTVDLRETVFLDAAGIRAIVGSATACEEQGGRLRIVHVRTFQRRLLTQLQLGHLLDAGPLTTSGATESNP